MSSTSPMERVPPEPPQVGRAVGRVEDGPLLTGAATFVDDIDLRGQAFARIVRSQIAHGRIASINVEAARRRDDVVAVITGQDLPDVRVPIRMLPTEEAERVLQPPLARGVVRYVGEPIAVVVATDPYAVEDAAAEIVVEIEPLDCVMEAEKAIRADAPALHEELRGNVINRVTARHGKPVDELLDRAAVVVRKRLRSHRHSAVPMETRGLAAEYDEDSGRLTVWGAAKVKHFNLASLAAMLDLEPERIRLVEVEVGGGFGVRGEFYPEDYIVPWLAVELRRPVKWIEDRAEHFVATNHAREQECEIAIGADAEGRLLALRARCLVNQGAYARTHGGVLLPMITVHHLPGPYTWEGLEIDCASVLTNKTPAGTYRGPSQYESTFFRERALDLLATRLGIEPAELRRRNLVPRERMPYTIDLAETVPPIVYDSGDFPHTWQTLLDSSAHTELRASVEKRRARGEIVGVGVAAYVEAGGFGPFENANVVPNDEGFVIHVGVASLGQGVRTGLGQIAADELGVPMDRVRISHHDTDVIPEGLGAFGSRTTILGGNAIVGAVRDLHERALHAAADRLEADAHELEIAGEVVLARGAPDREVRLTELECEGEFRYEKPLPSFSMGGTVALVSIDAGTGEPRVERYFMCHDVGRIVNPQIVDGQMAGAAAQGIAGALLEELAYSEEGQPLTTSFMDYTMPTAVEVPRFEATVLELEQHNPETANALGLKGCAESGIIGAAAAVSNAVADAVGARGEAILALPLTPERILTLLNDGRPTGRQ